MKKDIVVKKSKIHGRGVFAGRDFKKGEAVVKWEFKKKLLKKDLAELPRKYLKYVSRLNKKYFIVMTGVPSFVNHSCVPNTAPIDGADVAVHNIKAGEEITSNYNSGDSGVDFPCNCGSKRCRAKIV